MSSSTAAQSNLSGQVLEKLSRTNYVLWRTQVAPQLRGARLVGYVDGTMTEPARLLVTKDKDGNESSELNPLHPILVKEDQPVLGYLLNKLPKEVLIAVTAVTTLVVQRTTRGATTGVVVVAWWPGVVVVAATSTATTHPTMLPSPAPC